MTNLVKIMFPLFFLALLACGQPNSSSSAAETKTMETVQEEVKEEQPKEIADNAMEKVQEVEEESNDKNVVEKKESTEEKVTEAKKAIPVNKEKTVSKKETIAEKKSSSTSQPTSSPVSKPSTDIKVKEAEKKEPTEEKVLKVQNVQKEVTKEIEKLNHKAWDNLLKANVSSSGKVNYSGFKNSQSELDSYLESLKNNAPASNWSKNEKLAYWINAYNAFTVKLIVENYPVSSITKLHNGKPWDEKWIKIGGKSYSLNNIENDIIRPTFKEPRIHFAVNCAAQSCPPLLNRAWTAENLNGNFEKQAKAFINNSKYNNISASEIQVSKIFEWYAEDFGNLIDFLNKYSETKINPSAKVSFKEYDWTLNN